MKRVILSFLLLGTLCFYSSAQDMKFGVHSGIDAATFRISGAAGSPLKYKTGLTGGLSFEAMLNKLVSLQIEGNYSSQGTSIIAADGSTVTSIYVDYVTVPLLIKLNATPSLHFFAGPQGAFLIRGKSKTGGAVDTDVKELFENTAVSIVFGGEYEFLNGVYVGARFHHGVTNLATEVNGSSFRSQYYSFRLGYKFKL